MSNEEEVKASLESLLTGADPLDETTRAAIERAISELDGTHTAGPLQAALAAVEDALATATSVPTQIALAMAGRQLNSELNADPGVA